MHRSGTSAVTRGLQALGVHLGDRMMPATPGINDRGFWEDLDIHELNCEILQELETDWHRLTIWNPDFLPRLQERGFVERAVDLLTEKLARNSIIGMKNPRMTMLLPFWQTVFAGCAAETRYVVVIRNPISIVQSLVRRDGFDEEKIALLWLLHMVSAAEVLFQGYAAIVVDYDRMLQDPSRELQRMAATLDLPLDAAAASIYEHDFLTTDLRHSHHTVEMLQRHAFIGPMTEALYSALLAAASSSPIDVPRLRHATLHARKELARWEPALPLLDKLFEVAQQCRQSRSARDDPDPQTDTDRSNPGRWK